MYPAEDTSDLTQEVALAELVREQVLLRTRDELPHAVEVEIDELEERPDGSLLVRARVWAETESQKGILIGAGGKMIKAIGTAARREMTRSAGRPVHLDLTRARAARAGAATTGCSTGSGSSERGHRSRTRVPARGGGRGLRRGAPGSLRHGAADAEPAARVVAERAARRGPRRSRRRGRRRGRAAAGRVRPPAPDRPRRADRRGARAAAVRARLERRPPARDGARSGRRSASVEDGLAVEAEREVGAATLAAFRREQPFGWQEEAVRQLAEMDGRYTAAAAARDFVAPAARARPPPAACTSTARRPRSTRSARSRPERGRGYASAAVLAAAAAARGRRQGPRVPAHERGRLAAAALRPARLRPDRQRVRVPQAPV